MKQLMGNYEIPRFGSPATMMRLPASDSAKGFDVCFIGVPLDIGTSNRPGARLGPQQIRDVSRILRTCNLAIDVDPFSILKVADIGNVPINTFDINKSVEIIESYFDSVLIYDCLPLTMGGDHTVTLPILRSMAKKYGPVGLVQIDAHPDTNYEMFGEKITHGTPFRRAVEEGLLDCDRVAQIGLRSTSNRLDGFKWNREQGFYVIQSEECWHRSLAPLMQKVKNKVSGGPVYVTYDIDSLDLAYAPGTGTMEIGGLTTHQALEIIRGLKGLNLVGGDVMEVSPPYDPFGQTAVIGANLLFEMLCVLPNDI